MSEITKSDSIKHSTKEELANELQLVYKALSEQLNLIDTMIWNLNTMRSNVKKAIENNLKVDRILRVKDGEKL